MKNNKINPFIEIGDIFEPDEYLIPITSNSVKGVIPKYCISNKGNVYSTTNDKFRKLVISNEIHNDDTSYQIVSLSCRDEYGKQKTKKVKVHRIVGIEMIKGRDVENNIDIIDHLDGDKTNNNIENLEWVTQQENVTRAKINGLLNRPLENDEEKIKNIARELINCKLTMDQIAEKYNVSKSTIMRIKNGSYSDKVGEVNFSFRQFLSKEDIEDIYNRSFTNEDWNNIAVDYNISFHTVREIHYPNGTKYEEPLRSMGYDPKRADILSKEQIIEIRKKADAGMSDEELAKEYNKSEHTILFIRKGRDRYRETLEEAGFISDESEKELTDGDMLRIYEDSKNGMSIDEVAKRYNVHKSTVKALRTGSKYKYLDFLKRYNLPKIMVHNRKIVKENRFSEEEAINLYNEMKNNKLSTRAMATKYGCDKSLMANIKYCRGSYSYLQEKYGLDPLS